MATEKILPEGQSNPLPEAPKSEELIKAVETKSKGKSKSKAPADKAPKITKKMIVDEYLRNKKTKGATIETIAQAIVDRGVDTDMRANLVTCKLWMSKIGYKVVKDDKTKKYRKAS